MSLPRPGGARDALPASAVAMAFEPIFGIGLSKSQITREYNFPNHLLSFRWECSIPDLSERERLITRILRVNHAGEHGAIAIYSAQLASLSKKHGYLAPWLHETLTHEIQHRDLFRTAMPSRNAKPCRAIGIWSVGGSALGCLTALFGPLGIMVCTAAVERTVHCHLEEQIAYLKSRDKELASIIGDIQSEEDAHLAYAEARHDPRATGARFLSAAVASATELLIWISTRGDSLNLRKSLRAAAKE